MDDGVKQDNESDYLEPIAVLNQQLPAGFQAQQQSALEGEYKPWGTHYHFSIGSGNIVRIFFANHLELNLASTHRVIESNEEMRAIGAPKKCS